MDKKSLIIFALCFALFFGWQMAVNRFWPDAPPGKGPAEKASVATNAVSTAATPSEVKAASVPPAAPVALPPSAPSAPKPPEKIVTLENKLLRAELTTYGGGIRDVLLKEWKISTKNPALVTLNSFATEPLFALTGGSVKGTNDIISPLAWPGADSNAVFTLTENAPDRVVLTANAADGLRIVKEFALSGDYMLTCKVRLENTGTRPMETPAFGVAVGTAGQLDEHDDATFVYADYWDGGPLSLTGRAKATYTAASSLAKKDLLATNGVHWAAVKNRYFALVVSTKDPAHGFHAQKVDLPQMLTPSAKYLQVALSPQAQEPMPSP